MTTNNAFLEQLKQRRLALGLKQSDMLMRVGISRQQYQRLEAQGNPRLDTLELVAAGLNAELMLIPKDKLAAVMAVLKQAEPNQHYEAAAEHPLDYVNENAPKSLVDDPWQGLLGDIE